MSINIHPQSQKNTINPEKTRKLLEDFTLLLFFSNTDKLHIFHFPNTDKLHVYCFSSTDKTQLATLCEN